MALKYQKTWLEIANICLRRCGQPTVEGLEASQKHQRIVIDLLKEVHNEVQGLSDWRWLEKSAILVAEDIPLVIAGLDVNAEDPLMVKAVMWGTEDEEKYVNGYVQLTDLAGEPACFFITNAAVGSVTVEPVPMETQDPTGIEVYQDGLILPADFDREVGAESFLVDYADARPVDLFELWRRRIMEGVVTNVGQPRAYCILGDVTSSDGSHTNEGQRRLLIHPWPQYLQYVRVLYIRKVPEPTAGAELFEMPPDAVEAVITGVQSDWYNGAKERPDPRGEPLRQKYVSDVQKLLRHYERTSNRPEVSPDTIDEQIHGARNVFL